MPARKRPSRRQNRKLTIATLTLNGKPIRGIRSRIPAPSTPPIRGITMPLHRRPGRSRARILHS